MSRHARVPLEAFEDRRLHPVDFRVLAALYSFADGSGHCYPKRAQLAERANIKIWEVSRRTSSLVNRR